MACFTCTTNSFRELSKAMAKSAGARLRRMGVLQTSVDWTTRATLCEQCPLRFVRGSVSYCGKPFLEKVDREAAIDGCGCPTREKAKSPEEHCPLDARHRPAVRIGAACNCKWCLGEKSE